jgi:hypothetical protein
MVLIILIMAYCEYLIIRKIVRKKWHIELDLLPDRYGDDLKRTWLNAGVFLGCFVVTLIIMCLIFGLEFFATV